MSLYTQSTEQKRHVVHVWVFGIRRGRRVPCPDYGFDYIGVSRESARYITAAAHNTGRHVTLNISKFKLGLLKGLKFS